MFSWLFNLFQKPKQVETPKPTRSYLDYDWEPVIEFETGGKSYYERVLQSPTWPGGASGVTIGIGVDLGYISRAEFDKYFAKYFSEVDANLLRSVIGIKGIGARSHISRLSRIKFPWVQAKEAFVVWTLPKFWNLTVNLWPGIEELCEAAQVALVSIVFNRGSSIRGETRREMFNIKKKVLDKDYKGIAQEITSMKRLWVNKGLNGLLKRRDREAQMVLSCA
jgi:hypothetical protein